MAFDPLTLFCLGLVLVLLSSLHSGLVWFGHPREHGLGHVLAAATLQGLALLAHLARPWAGGAAEPANLLLLLFAAYGLWAIRHYAGRPARMDGWGWTALGSWVVVALAFHVLGFPWVRGMLLPATLAIVVFCLARELWGLPREGEFKRPAQVCAMLAVAMALAGLGAGVASAYLPADSGAYAPPVRAWFGFGILGAQQFFTVLLGQVQGQRVRRRLDRLVDTDPVTGLASARGFEERLDRAVRRSLRTGKVSSILIADIDDFAAMAKEYGPAPMIHVLEAFACTMNQTLREADFLGRLEEGRFAALLHQTQPLDALLAAERLREAWGNLPLTLGAHTFQSTLSGGAASTREPIEGYESLLTLAMDRAVAVRMGGGNNVEG